MSKQFINRACKKAKYDMEQLERATDDSAHT